MKLLQALVIALSCYCYHATFAAELETSGATTNTINWFNAPQLQTLLDKETHSTAYPGNKVILLVNGVTSAAARKLNIANADIILIKTYEFWNDTSGKELIQLLALRAKAGAKIFIQFDVKGTRHTAAEQRNIWLGITNPIPDYLQQLQQTYPNNVYIIPTSVPDTFTQYFRAMLGIYVPLDHEKYIITWNSQDPHAPVMVIMGGMNIGDEYLFGGVVDANGKFKEVPKLKAYAFRDTDIVVMGPVVSDIVSTYIQRVKYHLQNNNRYFQASLRPKVNDALVRLIAVQQAMEQHRDTAFPQNVGNALARFVTTAPHREIDQDNLDIQSALATLMGAIPSGNTVSLSTAYFLPTDTLQTQMMSAAARGVIFKLLINAKDAVDSSFVDVATTSRCNYKYLLTHVPADTMQLYEWHGSPMMGVSSLHQKVFAFGEAPFDPFIVGSSNLDSQSLQHNSEDILLIQDPDVKQEFDAMLANDFQQPKVAKITVKELDQATLKDWFISCHLWPARFYL